MQTVSVAADTPDGRAVAACVPYQGEPCQVTGTLQYTQQDVERGWGPSAVHILVQRERRQPATLCVCRNGDVYELDEPGMAATWRCDESLPEYVFKYGLVGLFAHFWGARAFRAYAEAKIIVQGDWILVGHGAGRIPLGIQADLWFRGNPVYVRSGDLTLERVTSVVEMLLL
jgi:hypothetical protein